MIPGFSTRLGQEHGWNLEDLDENLAWLTQKIEDPKGIKGTLLSLHTHSKCDWTKL